MSSRKKYELQSLQAGKFFACHLLEMEVHNHQGNLDILQTVSVNQQVVMSK